MAHDHEFEVTYSNGDRQRFRACDTAEAQARCEQYKPEKASGWTLFGIQMIARK